MEKGALLGRGGTAEVYAWGSDRVVKLFTRRYAYSADPEFHATRAAHAAGVRCPEPLERIKLEGREAIVFERIVVLIQLPRHPDRAALERMASLD